MMLKVLILVALGALLGGFSARFVVQHFETVHRHSRSVMTLLAFHQQRLAAAAKAGRCDDFVSERARLAALQPEIALALPQAYQREPGFRKSADALGTVLQAGVGAGAEASPLSCPMAAMRAKQVADACEDCHKVYDPS